MDNQYPPGCKGCFIASDGACKIIHKYTKYYPCPCFNCIVKVMCSSHSCYEFDVFEDYALKRMIKEKASNLKYIKDSNNDT